jgi:hypothetical protein
VCLCLFKCLPLFSFVGPFGGHWIQSKFKNPNKVSNCLTPVFHPNDIVGAILLLWAEIMSLRGQFVVGGGWMEHLHPPTNTRPQFYRLLVFITSKTVLNYLPIRPTLNMCALTRSIIKEDSRGKGGWLVGWACQRKGWWPGC